MLRKYPSRGVDANLIVILERVHWRQVELLHRVQNGFAVLWILAVLALFGRNFQCDVLEYPLCILLLDRFTSHNQQALSLAVHGMAIEAGHFELGQREYDVSSLSITKGTPQYMSHRRREHA